MERINENQLGAMLMAVFTEVKISRKGLTAATSALAMAWATLRDVARMEGIDVEQQFEHDLKRFTLTLNP